MGGKPLVYRKFRRLMEKLKAEMGLRVVDYIDPGRKWKKLQNDTCSQEDLQLLKELKELINAKRLSILIQEDKVV